MIFEAGTRDYETEKEKKRKTARKPIIRCAIQFVRFITKSRAQLTPTSRQCVDECGGISFRKSRAAGLRATRKQQSIKPVANCKQVTSALYLELN